MNAPRHEVSVCIPTCNHGRYIRQCLESVLAQTQDARVQILVGDDCSEDSASQIIAEIAAAYPDCITHLRHAPRVGPTRNMQALMSRCTGDYIARMDGDDYWLPGKLKRQIAYLDAHPECAAVYTNTLTVDEAGNLVGLFNDVGDARFDLAAMLRRGNFLNNSSVLFRAPGKMAWLSADKTVLDYYAHLWHARSGFLAQLAEPLTVYRINAQGSMVATMNAQVRQLYWDAILSVPRELVSDSDFAHGITDFLRRVVYRALHTGQWELVREWMPRVLAASPYGKASTAFLTVGSILRIALKEVMGRIRREPDGRRIAVLYRR